MGGFWFSFRGHVCLVAKYPCRCHQVRASLTTFPPTSNLNKSPRNNTRPRSSYKLINKLSLNCYTNFHFTFINYNGFANLNALEESEFRCSLISAKGAQRHRHLYISWSSRTVSLRRWWLSTAISEWRVIVRISDTVKNHRYSHFFPGGNFINLF